MERNFRKQISPIPMCLAALLVAFAGLSVPSTRALATVQTRNPEDLLIVDCLLPGQVRKLGRSASFMGGRRPIRTT